MKRDALRKPDNWILKSDLSLLEKCKFLEKVVDVPDTLG